MVIVLSHYVLYTAKGTNAEHLPRSGVLLLKANSKTHDIDYATVQPMETRTMGKPLSRGTTLVTPRKPMTFCKIKQFAKWLPGVN